MARILSVLCLWSESAYPTVSAERLMMIDASQLRSVLMQWAEGGR